MLSTVAMPVNHDGADCTNLVRSKDFTGEESGDRQTMETQAQPLDNNRDEIFQTLPPEALVEVARYLSFTPLLSRNPHISVASLCTEEQARYFDTHRLQIEDEVCSVGSWTFGETKPYAEIVHGLAEHMNVACPAGATTSAIELSIATKLWNDTLKRLSPEETAELKAKAAELAAKYGKELGKEMTGFAALTAAQLSGFGVYLLGSTLLGALNGALGLGLSFGAFTGLSSLISTVIGPVGWAALGLATVIKLGAPNYKKILPVVILIATQRSALATKLAVKVKRTARSPIASVSRQVARAVSTVKTGSEEKTPATPEQIQNITKDIARYSKSAKRTKSTKTRKISKNERTVFALRYPEICAIAKQLGVDYHEETPANQAVIHDIARERKESQNVDAPIQESSRVEKQSLPNADRGSSRGTKVAQKKKEFKHLLDTLEFTEAALQHFCLLPHETAVPFLSEFSQMNKGFLNAKHQVPKTKPKVFQRDAGSAGRIYYRRQDGPATVRIELIGTKGTEQADYRALQNAKR